MGHKVKGFTVTLEQDYSEEDVEIILNAVRMIRGVAHVEPSLTTCQDHMAKVRLKFEMKDKFYKFMKEYLT